MVMVYKRRLDNDEIISTKYCTDNWFTVYQDNARFSGRRLYWNGRNCFTVIFTEKNYALTLLKLTEEEPDEAPFTSLNPWDAPGMKMSDFI